MPSSPLNLEHLEISRHAWRQFTRRYYHLNGRLPSCPWDTLRSMLRNATPEDLGPGAVHRLLDNGGVPVNYFRCGKWRFVVSEDMTRLVTVEIPYLQKPHHNKRRRRKF